MNFFFVVSHLCSGYLDLNNVLNNHPQIELYNSDIVYNHISSFDSILAESHKNLGPNALYGDTLLLNPSFINGPLFKTCKFIYLIKHPEPVIKELSLDKYNLKNAVNYYRFRLRRMFEMARETPGGVFLTYDNLLAGRGGGLISGYLDLISPIEEIKMPQIKIEAEVSSDILNETRDCYEGYLYKLKQLDLKRV